MIRDTFYTMIPVNRLLRIFALTSVKRKQNKLVQSWSLTENIIVVSVMMVVNIFFLVNKIQGFKGYKKNEGIKFTDTLQLTYFLGYTEFIVDLVLIYKSRHICLKYLQLYTSIDKILTVPNFAEIRKKNFKALTFIIVSFMVSTSLDYTSWYMEFGWIVPTLYALDYLYYFVNALTALDVIANVVQIEYRLKVMVGVIENCYASSLSPSVGELPDQGWVSERMLVHKIRVERLRVVSYNKFYGILSLSKYYMLLIEQATYINKAYGVRLVTYCVNLLMNLTYLTNVSIRVSIGILTKYMKTKSLYHIPEITMPLRLVNYASILFTLVYRCEQTYKQCSNIVRQIDFTVINTKIPEDLKTSLMELRTLVLSRPIKFHGAYFFTLDFPLLLSLLSVIVTYTIILLQSLG